MGFAGCELKIDGKADPIEDYLVSVELSESADILDSLKVQLRLPFGADRTKLLTLCQPGKTWELAFGKRKAKGDITRVSLNLGGTGVPSVVLFGLEALNRLRLMHVSKKFEDPKHKIVSTLIKQSKASVKATAVGASAKELVMIDPSALGLLKSLADERNFSIRYDGKTLQFNKRNQTGSGSKVVLKYEGDVKDLRLTMDVHEVVSSVEVHGFDYTKAKAFKYKAAAKDLKKISKGKTAIQIRETIPGKVAMVLDERLRAVNNTEVKELAVGELQRRAESFLSGKVLCRGNPDAMPSKPLHIDDSIWPVAGPFLIREAVHRFSVATGYETRISFFSDAMCKVT